MRGSSGTRACQAVRAGAAPAPTPHLPVHRLQGRCVQRAKVHAVELPLAEKRGLPSELRIQQLIGEGSCVHPARLRARTAKLLVPTR